MEKKNVTYEVCPHCDHEVELPNTLGVHECPNCHKMIVNCSMCKALQDNKAVCSSCPLSYLAKDMNEDKEYTDLSIAIESLHKYIGKDIVPLNDIEYAGANGIGKAVSIRLVNRPMGVVAIGYDVNGFLFTEERLMSELIYTDFLTYVMDEVSKPRKFVFKNGTAVVRINQAIGYGTNMKDALNDAKKEIEKCLTAYGDVDTQIDDINVDIKLN